jgi:hypothetical protein
VARASVGKCKAGREPGLFLLIMSVSRRSADELEAKAAYRNNTASLTFD